MKYRIVVSLLISLGLSAAAAQATAAGAHVHGQAELFVAREGDTLSITLESPLDSLIGFEHAPRTAQQRQAVQEMAEKLRSPHRLFVLSPAAGCVAGESSLSAPELGLGVASAKAAADGHGHGHGRHASITADYTFKCADVAELKSLEVGLFDAFKRLRRVDAQVIGSRNQRAVKLAPENRQIGW